MNTKVKIIGMIIITFILGIVIGALANRAFVHSRIRRTFAVQNPALFARSYMHIIRPDEQQAKNIRKILNAHLKQMSEMRLEFLDKMRSSWESLQKDLDALLTSEQRQRLEHNPPRPIRRLRRFRSPGQPPPLDQRRNLPRREKRPKRPPSEKK